MPVNRSYFTFQMARKLNCCFYVLRTAYRLDFLYEGANFPYKEDKQQQINFHYGCKVKTFWPKAGEKSGCLLGSSIGKDICLSSRKEWFDSITEYNKPEVQGNEHAGYVETSQYTSKLSPVRNRWSGSVIPSCW